MAKKTTLTTIKLVRIEGTTNYAKFRLDKKKDGDAFGQVYIPKDQAGDAKSITITLDK